MLYTASANQNNMINHNYNMYCNPHGKKQLSPFFQPGPYDCICARGKDAFNHEGNRRFRALVKMHQESYASSTCKYQKSKVVSKIVNPVRQASPQGGFVKLVKGVWYEVGDRAAKEKIGQTFRDLLHTKYSSSTKAKAQRRIQRRINHQDTASPELQSSSNSDDVKSSVSIVSNDSDDQGEDIKETTPTFITIQTTKPQQRQEPESSLFDTLLSNLELPETTSDDLEPLPLDSIGATTYTIDFLEAEVSSSFDLKRSFDEDCFSDFCERMGMSI